MNTGIDLSPPPPPPPPADDGRLALPDAEFNTPDSASKERICPNCGAPVHGPFCYACGQSEKGMIRHLSEVLADLADIVFNVDSRIFRSIWDLYLRPGFLTIEYLAGRRARYITPFRLFFFLTIVAFFAMQASIRPEDIHFDTEDIEDASTPEMVNKQVEEEVAALTIAMNAPGLSAKAKDNIETKIARTRDTGNQRALEIRLEGAHTPDEVRKLVDESIASLKSSMDVAGGDAELKADLDGKTAEVRESGEQRLAELKEDAVALAAGKPLPDRTNKKGAHFFDLEGKPWDPVTNPVAVKWWPEALNRKLNNTISHMEGNIKVLQKEPERLVVGWFSVLPQTLFVVMPLFAVLLKIFYLFKRRLYMEHLLVALHSHAFIFASVLVILFLTLLAGWAENSPVLLKLVDWLRVAAWIWLFTYLLIMQKRIYRQGWFMTLLKYCVIGLCYTIFLGFAIGISAVVALAFT